MNIPKDKLVKIIVAAAVAAAGAAYLLLFQPLINKLKGHRLSCNAIEAEACQARETVAAVKKNDKKTLLKEAGVSAAIDELTRLAKVKGLKLISVTPLQVRPAGSSAEGEKKQYGILPVEMEVESAYEDLGAFLGSLRGFENSLVAIDSFHVLPDGERPLNLKTKAVINIYLAREEDAE